MRTVGIIKTFAFGVGAPSTPCCGVRGVLGQTLSVVPVHFPAAQGPYRGS